MSGCWYGLWVAIQGRIPLAFTDDVLVAMILSTYNLLKVDAGLSLCLQAFHEFREGLHISNWWQLTEPWVKRIRCYNIPRELEMNRVNRGGSKYGGIREVLIDDISSQRSMLSSQNHQQERNQNVCPRKFPFQPERQWSIHSFVYSADTCQTLKHELVKNCKCVKSYEEETHGAMGCMKKAVGVETTNDWVTLWIRTELIRWQGSGESPREGEYRADELESVPGRP